MSETYEPTGNESIVETREKVPCGYSVSKAYYVGDEKVREDIRIEVDEETLGLLLSKHGVVK